MVPRYKKMGEQLGKKIPDPGAHMPHVVVGILLKRRKKGKDELYVKGGSKQKPVNEYNPYPEEEINGGGVQHDM